MSAFARIKCVTFGTLMPTSSAIGGSSVAKCPRPRFICDDCTGDSSDCSGFYDHEDNTVTMCNNNLKHETKPYWARHHNSRTNACASSTVIHGISGLATKRAVVVTAWRSKRTIANLGPRKTSVRYLTRQKEVAELNALRRARAIWTILKRIRKKWFNDHKTSFCRFPRVRKPFTH